MTDTPTPAPALVDRASNKHCEPLTAQKPGTKCPRWSETRAQELPNESVEMGAKRIATRHRLAFVAQDTNDGTWHGYPEPWDKIDAAILTRWLDEGRIKRRHLRQWASREYIRTAWKELDDAE
ncbi:MAG: hypothetical protein ACP5NP_00705 [Acetobacteraceae bacterium]